MLVRSGRADRGRLQTARLARTGPVPGENAREAAERHASLAATVACGNR